MIFIHISLNLKNRVCGNNKHTNKYIIESCFVNTTCTHTHTNIIESCYGNKTHNYIISDLKNNAYSHQFKFGKSTCGKDKLHKQIIIQSGNITEESEFLEH